jgi:hypothetical protein
MAQPPPEVLDLAHRLLRHETGGSPDAESSAAAVDAACGRFKQLDDVLGAGGVAALMGRALHLAKREWPLLAAASFDPESSSCFTGLAAALAGGTDEEAAAAAESVLAQMLGLLVVLLGEELGLQPVRKLWPRLASSPTEIRS